MPVLSFDKVTPTIDPSAFIAPDCWITGNVKIKQNCSLFFGACIRGDLEPIEIGENSNIQELSILHTSKGVAPCIVGPNTTIGHRAILRSCHIEGSSIIGMGAIVLDKAVIQSRCIIGANSLVTIGTIIPEGHLAFGNPARVIRKLTNAELDQIEDTWQRYIEVGRKYK